MERSKHTLHTASSAPRRKAARRGFRLRPWARAGLLAVFVGMMLALCVGLVVKAVKPYREARQQGRQLSDSRAHLQQINAQNAELRQRIAYLKTADGQMTEARKHGFVRPGEIPFVVEDGGASPSASTPAVRPAPRAWPQVLWQRATRH